MAGSILAFSKIENAYQSFWQAFQANAVKSPSLAKTLHPAGFKCTNVEGSAHDVQVSGTFHLKSWPFRGETDGIASRRRIDIIASGWDKYDCSKGMLSASNIKVMYLRAQTTGPFTESLLQVHYDFQANQGPRHPVFHAQFANVKFSEPDLSKLGIKLDLTSSTNSRIPAVRIPTPFVGLAGLLLGLAADHWDETSFLKFLKNTQEAIIVSWQPKSDSLMKNLMPKGGKPIRSIHWYGCT